MRYVRMGWPDWWDWPILLQTHVLKRMGDHRFDDVDLPAMLDDAESIKSDQEEGRWVARTIHGGRAWEVIVEPDELVSRLVIVSAYPIE